MKLLVSLATIALLLAPVAFAPALAQTALRSATPIDGAATRPARPVVRKSQPTSAPAQADAYWYDGSKRRELRTDREHFADFTAERGDAPRGRPQVRKSFGAGPANLAGKSSPLFRAVGSPASAPRALPGGIVVTLRTAGDTDHANRALAPFKMRVTRSIDPSGRRWYVATEPGIAALEQANRLHESGAFQSVAPDWWIGVAKK